MTVAEVSEETTNEAPPTRTPPRPARSAARRELGRGERVLPGVYRLRLPLPWPGVPHCNAWAVASRGGYVLSDADGATLARCAGAVDFARLAADISDAAARVRGWYRELIEEPARHAAMQLVEHTGEPTR